MYGVQDSQILLSLEGAFLVQVCFGENEVILRYDGGQKITIMGDIAIPEHDFRPAHPNEISSALVNLLGKKIAFAKAIDPKTLQIDFENGYCMRIFDDDPHYESFIIEVSGQIMVV